MGVASKSKQLYFTISDHALTAWHFCFYFLVGTANRLNLTLLGFGFARLGCLVAQIELLSRNFLSLTLAARIADFNSKNAISLSSARTFLRGH